MSIDISGISGRRTQGTGSSGKSESSKRSGSADSSASTGDDQVSLTDSASQLQQLTAQVAALPIVDADQVEKAQRAIATGNFQFEPIDAADNLLTQERQFAMLEQQQEKEP